MLDECKECPKIRTALEKYNFDDYYKKFVTNSKMYSNHHKNKGDVQRDIV